VEVCCTRALMCGGSEIHTICDICSVNMEVDIFLMNCVLAEHSGNGFFIGAQTAQLASVGGCVEHSSQHSSRAF
jgi:hypothetical protein